MYRAYGLAVFVQLLLKRDRQTPQKKSQARFCPGSPTSSWYEVTRRKGASVRGSWSSVQSSSPDCYLMGIDGCAGQGDTSEGSRGIEKIEDISARVSETAKNGFGVGAGV